MTEKPRRQNSFEVISTPSGARSFSGASDPPAVSSASYFGTNVRPCSRYIP